MEEQRVKQTMKTQETITINRCQTLQDIDELEENLQDNDYYMAAVSATINQYFAHMCGVTFPMRNVQHITLLIQNMSTYLHMAIGALLNVETYIIYIYFFNM